jgi:hypothetical protein
MIGVRQDRGGILATFPAKSRDRLHVSPGGCDE